MNPVALFLCESIVYGMNRKILQLAVPSIVSNVTVPLLGLVDVAIVGHLGSAAYIGAIAVGGMLFNLIYWVFGFLRMGTSGMASQAYGRRDLTESARVLCRAVGVGLVVAGGLLLLRHPILDAAFTWIDATDEVRRWASLYFLVCVWGAPALLSLYGFVGWFIGMQNTRFPMYIAIAQNVVNIAASLAFVYGLGMRVEGVALGTLVAQYAGLALAVALWARYYGRLRRYMRWEGLWDRRAMRRFLAVNSDIFLRTLCLVTVTTFFTSAGAGRGDVILAVNTLLMQLFTLFSYIMDGFAYAGEALTGRLVGAANAAGLRLCVRRLFQWGAGLALAFTSLYALGGEGFLGLLTSDAAVVDAAGDYYYWTLAIPLCGFAAFLWDGVFIGATATRQMLYSMSLASATFFAVYYAMEGRMGNHALWLAFLAYLSLRGLAQWALWRRRGGGGAR